MFLPTRMIKRLQRLILSLIKLLPFAWAVTTSTTSPPQ